VWQFLRGVEETVNYSFVDRYLPFVSLALVADVMSQLSDETRFLTNEGVKIAETLPFFRACLDKMAFSIGDHITPEKCAWYIAPMYNALVRIGSQEEKEFCFKALLDSDATDLIPNETRGHTGEETMLVNEAIRKLNNIKNRQNTQKMKFTEQINDYIVENHIADNQVIFIPIPARDASSFRPLSGLISNQLQDLYQRPAILVFGNADDTEYSGSLRAPSNVPELANFRQFILDSNLLEWAQGHAQAAGLAIKKKNINDFVAYCNQRLSGLDLTSAYDVDFVFDAKDPALSDLIFDLEEYSDIWTTSLDEPLILIDNIEISGKNLVCYEKKTVTLKINLPNGVEMIKFNSSREEYQSFFINDNSDGTMFWRCRAVGKASVNEWHGKKTA
jgi:single-stranded DNA-specific DHH superfamily exonuclease